MGIYANDVQKLYIAYFNRPADPIGLQYWEDQITANKGSTAAVANAFSASAEYKALYAGKTSAQIVDTIYQNLFGRAAEASGLVYWGVRLENGTFNIGNITMAILTGAQNDDKKVVDNKVVVATEFTAALDTSAEIVSYAGDAAAASARTFLSTVGATDASLTAAKAAVASAVTAIATATVANGTTYNFTTSVDNFVGTANNDSFNATVTGTSATLGGLDTVDGGAGTDTVNIADTAVAAAAQFSLPAGFTVTNVEAMNVTTNGGVNMDISTITGLTSFKAVAAGTANTAVTAAKTQDVTTTVSGAATTTITGGKVVKATAGTGAVAVTGADLTSVSVKGGDLSGANAIDNGAAVKTLTSVTLESVDTAANIRGAGVTELTLKGATTAGRTTTITNATADHTLTINVDGTGYTSAGAAAQSVVADSVAKTINVNATGSKSSLSLAGSTTATSVVVKGSAALTLTTGALANITSIQGFDATGALTLGTLNAAATTVTTGSGNDSMTVAATTKATIGTGAGDDTVTLGSALAAGSNVTLGAGNDKLLSASGSVATSTATAVTVIDAGDGTDSVSASLINAGNAGQFKNFESLDLSATSNLDVALMTGSTITGLTLSGDAGANHTSVVSNVARGVGLTVSGDNTGAGGSSTTIGVKDAATATDDAFTITFAGAAATTAPVAASIKAGPVTLNGVESITIASAGGANTWNSIALTDDKLKTVTITGDKNLDLTFTGTNGTNTAAAAGGAVNLIDGSAATGKLSINTTNVTADDKAGVGLTVKGGSAADTITLAQVAKVDAGAGDDTITSAAAGGTFTGGAGKDVFDVKAAVYAVGGVVSVVTDFVVGTDKLTLANLGTEVFTATKVDISAATNLTGALDIAAAGAGNVNSLVKWFQYGADTYVVQDMTAGATIAATDLVVKLTGLVDLSTMTVADFNFA